MRLIRFGVPGVIVKVPTCNSSFTPLMKNLQMKTYMCLCRLHFISVSQFKCEMWLIPAHSLFLITFQGCHSVVCNVLTWKSFFFFFFFRISFTFYVHLLSRNTFFRSHFDFFFFFFLPRRLSLNSAVPRSNCNGLRGAGHTLKSDLMRGSLMSLKQILGPFRRE